MAEYERTIEENLITRLRGDTQWTYRPDLKTEADLWQNFKYILEQNNKARLDGEPLSAAEFEQVRNQLQFSSFYRAGEWLVGENGKVLVHVQRGTETLHLVVMNHEHIAGGTSVYEVINQCTAFKDEDSAKIKYGSSNVNRDRRFDVTLLINGLPLIHIELKNREHSYTEAFHQIKKYIAEGKFRGIYSAVQMFVVSNAVDTKYFAAASDAELNPKFMTGWVDADNKPVSNYLDFAGAVLRIPEAHEMIAKYTVLDEDAKRLILLRPYQIHAIESIREASRQGRSGFVWHTTGSGKTLTSYKATRNLLMDIPALEKTIFIIDRKDLDTQTTMAFQAYANNDLIDVDETDNVSDLKRKLCSGDRQVIVTTIQKLQILVGRRLREGTREYDRIRNLRVAFVVDECHRAVTPGTKRELERFFGRSLWYGFTGTPRFPENPYAQMGDLPRTTEALYGGLLHKYTIQNAIHDGAVLGFQVEHNGPREAECMANSAGCDGGHGASCDAGRDANRNANRNAGYDASHGAIHDASRGGRYDANRDDGYDVSHNISCVSGRDARRSASYDDIHDSIYETEAHMLSVLDIILNKSYYKLGFQNGKGNTYEAILTTRSIPQAQRYYELLTRVCNGETSLTISGRIRQVLPDFPKFAITYSVTENEEGSHVNQEKMQKSLDDYNAMFGTKFDISQIASYNGNLNKRLARKESKYRSRSEQLDLVIVVDRLLTGFDAPCLSTIYIDRPPMGAHDLIQAFSRTNRIYDRNKSYGQIVTFQSPVLFKERVDNAIRLYSAGSTAESFLAEWEEVKPAFGRALAALRACAGTPAEVPGMSVREQRIFARLFQEFDRLFAQLQSFSCYEDSMLEEYGFSEWEYEDYAGQYLNVREALRGEPGEPGEPGDGGDDGGLEGNPGVDPDYELMAYSNTKIDYEYIIRLIQNIVSPEEGEADATPEERQKLLDEVKAYVEELRRDNPKVAGLMATLIAEIETDEEKYRGQSIWNVVEHMKQDCIEREISEFCRTWFAVKDDVMYAAYNYRNGTIPNESAIRDNLDYAAYKTAQPDPMPKFRYYKRCLAELRSLLEGEIVPLVAAR